MKKIAVNELIRVFEVKYLQKIFNISCTAEGMVTDDTYQLFLGIKGSKEFPEKANGKGWVVYGQVYWTPIPKPSKDLSTF